MLTDKNDDLSHLRALHRQVLEMEEDLRGKKAWIRSYIQSKFPDAPERILYDYGKGVNLDLWMEIKAVELEHTATALDLKEYLRAVESLVAQQVSLANEV